MLRLISFSLKTSTAAFARSSVSDSMVIASSPAQAIDVPVPAEVEPLRELLRGLVEGVVDLLPVDLAHDVERRVGHGSSSTGPLQGPAPRCRMLRVRAWRTRRVARAANGSGL